MEKTYVITGDHKGLSLFHFLKAVLPDLDRKFLRRLVGAGQALVNGTTRIRAPSARGRSRLARAPRGPAAKRPIEPPRVLYEDAAIIALDKPAGISAIRERDRARDTIVDAYLASLPEASRPQRAPPRRASPGQGHQRRCCCSRARARRRSRCTREFVARRVEKSYLALVIGPRARRRGPHRGAHRLSDAPEEPDGGERDRQEGHHRLPRERRAIAATRWCASCRARDARTRSA
jgi:23S rRNA-/tRNA-specific pseudouridylate synthase